MTELYDYKENGWRFESDDYVDGLDDPPVMFETEWCKKTFVRDYPEDYDVDDDNYDDLFDDMTEVEITVQAEPFLYEYSEENGVWTELTTEKLGLADNWENGINVEFPNHETTWGHGYSWANNLKSKLYDIAYKTDFYKTLNIIDTFMMLEGWRCDDL